MIKIILFLLFIGLAYSATLDVCKLVLKGSWPNCCNLGCFSEENFEEASEWCANNQNCEGFSYSEIIDEGSGCYKTACESLSCDGINLCSSSSCEGGYG